jgi:hypothetical protein
LVVVTTVAVVPRRPRSTGASWVALLAALTLLASLLAAPANVAAAEKPFRYDLWQEGDFVSQSNVYQCVGASMQMMLNLMSPSSNRTAARQLELQTLARSFRRNGNTFNASTGVVDPTPQRQPRGASSRGWANGLTVLGMGRYGVTTGPNPEEAIRTAAIQMRKTGRPVGLLVWQGRHAWVVSGFEATGDPLYDREAEITHVWVLDPFYPRSSSTWGRMAPHTKLTISQLSQDWVEWRRRSGPANMGPRWAMVVPYTDIRPADRRTNLH